MVHLLPEFAENKGLSEWLKQEYEEEGIGLHFKRWQGIP
jgi:hypothetical protein